MGTITITLPSDVKAELKRFSWVNWSEVARDIFFKRLKKQEELERLDKLLKNSELTDEDIIKLTKKARKGRFKELQEKELV